MPDHTPHHRAVTIDDLIDNVLRPVLGDHLGEFYAEAERHDREMREIPDRIRRQMQPKFHAILQGHTGEPDENGYGVAAEMELLQFRTHEAARQALLAEQAEHRLRISELESRS